MSIKAVLFDLDGVIVTTDDCHYKAWKMMADNEGIYFDRKINERLRGVSRMDSLKIILENAQKKYTDAEKNALAEKKNNIYVDLIQKLTPKEILPGVVKNLDALKENGIKIAIASSSKNAKTILTQIGLIDCFDAISDGNNIKKSKPDPEVFLRAADMLGIAYECCMVVEDADAGILAGKAAGMKTVAVANAMGGDYKVSSLENVDLIALCK